MPVKPETAAAFSLLSADAVRGGRIGMLAMGLEDGFAHFRIDLGAARGRCRPRRRDHARGLSGRSMCRSTRAGGISWPGPDRWADDRPRHALARRQRARTGGFDLAIVSVLLDAGAGPHWVYRDAATGARVGRSEGLALASLAMFADGAFSSDPASPLRADAAALRRHGRRGSAPALPGQRRQPAGGPRRPRRRCCAGSAPPWRRARLSSRAPMTPRPGGLFDHLAGLAEGGRHRRRPPSCTRCCGTWGRSGPRGWSSAACRSATAGAIPRSPRTTRPTGWCRCTSCRSG